MKLSNKAFSMVEILIVIITIGIVTAIISGKEVQINSTKQTTQINNEGITWE